MDIMEALSQDPRFMMGMTLLGGANTRNAPLQQAAAMLMQMNTSKRKQEMEQAKIAQEKMQTDLYSQQIEQHKIANQNALRKQTMDEELMKQGMKYLQNIPGFGGAGGAPAIPGMPQTPSVPYQQQQAPQLDPMTGQPIQQQTPPEPPTPIQQLFRSRIIPQESGGQQFKAPGIPLTSTKGAIGIAQVMPTTGPEAAALAGLPWSLERLNNDPEYNAKLGEAYFTKQMQDFGSPDKAAAAYNAGPAATQRAIDIAAKAKRPELWKTFLPAETQDYIKKTVGDTPAPAQPTPPPPSTPLGLRNPGLPLIVAGSLMKGPAGLADIGKAMEPKNYQPGSMQVDSQGNIAQIPDPMGQAKLTIDQARLANETRKVNAEVGTAERVGVEKTQAQAKLKAADKAAYDTIAENAATMRKTAEGLLANPGLDRIVGATGGLISPRLLGGEARNAAANLETLKSQVMNDTLQAIRQASANGSSGYGSLDRNEGDNIKQLRATLDRSVTPSEIRKSVQAIIDYTEILTNRAKGVYESTYNEKLPKAGSVTELPQGATLFKTAPDGKKVFKLPNGQLMKED